MTRILFIIILFFISLNFGFAQNVPQADSVKNYDKMFESETSLWGKYKNRFKKEDYNNGYKFVRYFLFLEIGFNNYLENGKFPNEQNQQYAAGPLGSFNLNFGASLRLRFAKIFSLNCEYGLGWNNYRFQDKSTLLTKEDNGLSFSKQLFSEEENYEFEKSRLSVSYMNVGLIPMFHITKNDFSSENYGKIFKLRLGIGFFAGYRISSNMKYKFSLDDIKIQYKERKDFYINSFRYGIKAIAGIGEIIDIYISYDLQELFVKDKGPKLNTICIGFRLNI